MIFRDKEDAMSLPEQWFAESAAYTAVAGKLWGMIVSGDLPYDFSTGKVAGFALFHGVELFLKGGIALLEDPQTIHSFANLIGRFRKLYPGGASDFTFRIDDLAKIDKERPWESFFRYPVNVEGSPWLSSVHFEPGLWVEQADLFAADSVRLRPLIEERAKKKKAASATA